MKCLWRSFKSFDGPPWSLPKLYPALSTVLFVCCAVFGAQAEAGNSPKNAGVNQSQQQIGSLPRDFGVVIGHDIRFRRLPASTGMSQTRVSSVVQDGLGFLWFGTQYGLDRFDGYKFRVFKHEPGRNDSLSGVYIRSLFVDHSGTLWVGCDQSLDRFDPVNETFSHFIIEPQVQGGVPTPVTQISEDRDGMLWLSTSRGLYRLDPASGKITHFVHESGNDATISHNDVNSTGEDRSGHLWVADGGGLDEMDRKTGKVVRHIADSAGIWEFHEDKLGEFWVTTPSDSCTLATLDRRSNRLVCHAVYRDQDGVRTPIHIVNILESRDGTIWFSSLGSGLLKLDRARRQIVRYRSQPSDSESIGSENVISIFEDREGDIWTCFQEMEPDFFSERAPQFEGFTQKRGSLVNPLVTTIYEDRYGILWIGSMGGLNRIDRRAGTNTVPIGVGVGNEILSIVEDHSGDLLAGTYHRGVEIIDRETGQLRPYLSRPDANNLNNNPIMRLMFDREGTLWAGTYGGVSRLDKAKDTFVTFTPDAQSSVKYSAIAEDRKGMLWLGAQTGLHRFDPKTGQFNVYQHNPDDPQSVSDLRVNSVTFDRTGTLWLGTQNGLDKFDIETGKAHSFYERDGLAGNVVSCILEDQRGDLWMGTNNGLSRFDPRTQRFVNFSVADGLPGSDFTGWSTCFQSPQGEMFFGGFSGATAFFPDRIEDSSYVPTTVLTDFQLAGVSVPIGQDSPLKQSIAYSNTVQLSHRQNGFSIEFSALSYFNTTTNRYRYRLDGLDSEWHEVGSDQRIASYTTLPKGDYTFRVQGATSRGVWSDPGIALHIEILPAFWETWWFRSANGTAICLVLWGVYRFRVHQIQEQYNIRLAERLSERNRIARDLHDTLLQGFQGLILQFQAVMASIPRDHTAHRVMEKVLDSADEVLLEGRQSVQGLRQENIHSGELSERLARCGEQLALSHPAEFRFSVLGKPQELDAIVHDEAYLIMREALVNAFTHAAAATIEAEITYSHSGVRMIVRDDGRGIDTKILESGRIGHWGLKGMRERAEYIRAELKIWSQSGAGTEVDLWIPEWIGLPHNREHSLRRRIQRLLSGGKAT